MIPRPVEGEFDLGHIKLIQSLSDRSAFSRLAGPYDYLHKLSGLAKTLGYRCYVVSFEHSPLLSFAHALTAI